VPAAGDASFFTELPPEAARLLLALLCAHFFVDFVLQTDREARAVERLERGVIARHAALHAIAPAVVAFPLPGVWLPGFAIAIGVSHGVIDAFKSLVLRALCAAPTQRPVARWLTVFAVDQLLHVAVIAALVRLIPAGAIDPWWMWDAATGIKSGLLVVVLGFLLSVPVGGVVIGRMTMPFDHQIRLRGWKTGDKTGGLRDGGRTIGLLERTVIYFLVVSGNPGGVGFLIAAKSIFRFGELRDRANRMEAEYFLIGTLMSFAWAVAVSVAAVWLLERLPAG